VGNQFLSVNDVAKLLGFKKPDPVLALIRSGAIKASNVASRPGRATWRISPESAARFLAEREYVPPAAADRRTRRGRRKAQIENVPSYV
jgi:hypothetical protein